MIKFSSIDKYYGKSLILENFNLEIKQDSGIVAIIGPNGAGKSTLLRLLSGILDKNKGEIHILDNENYISQNSNSLKNNVAFISSSERMLYYKLSVEDNITYFNVLKGMSLEDIKSKISGVLKDIGLIELKDRLVESLLTGQKRKVSLGCILCSDKKIVILDEPTLGLDYNAKMDLKKALMDRGNLDNKLFIISSHDFSFLSELADENIFIQDGSIKDVLYEKIPESKFIEIYGTMG